MLKKSELEAEEERLRECAAGLPDDARKAFYRELSARLRDPDTYAALNWFFVVGLHHFYLGRWIRGCMNIALILIGGWLLFSGEWLPGGVAVAIVFLTEMWELFRSQEIVQDWNNRIFRGVLQRYTEGGRG